MSVTDVAPFTRSVPGLLLSVSAEGSVLVVVLRRDADLATVPTLTDEPAPSPHADPSAVRNRHSTMKGMLP